jgi:lipopolysaccharide export system protein LptA
LIRSFTILCVLAALLGATAWAAEENPIAGVKLIRVTGDKEQFDPLTQEFEAIGNARVEYGEILLTADQITGSATVGDVVATGQVQFKGTGKSLTGDSFTYNFKSDTGLATNAHASANNVYFSGESMASTPTKYMLRGATFTSCCLDRPHYCLVARELNFGPDNLLTAKKVSLVFHGRTLFTIPSYHAYLGAKRRKTGFRFPTVGSGDGSGFFTGYEFDLGPEPDTLNTLNVRLSTKWLFQGGVNYERLGNSPVFTRVSYREPFYGGTQRFVMVTRLPEVGIRFGPKNLEDRFSTSRESMNLSRGLIMPDDMLPTTHNVNFVGELSAGGFTQEPGGSTQEPGGSAQEPGGSTQEPGGSTQETDPVRKWRYDARAMSWTKPIEVAKNTFISPGLYGRISHYQTGETYTNLGLRFAAARQLSKDSFVSLAYIANSIHGTTPFNFDAVPLRNELAGRVGFPLGVFKIEMMGRYDLSEHNMFDTEVSVSKVYHCLEPKITWRKRFSQLSFSVGVVGF